MRERCNNISHEKFPLYGGRGIRVCGRWQSSFEAFVADMGLKPTPKHTIDRVDRDGNYEPGNCRWADVKEQNHNRKGDRRAPKFYTFNGTTLCVKEWAEAVGLPMHTLYARLRKGWTPEIAIFTPHTRRTNIA